VTRASLTLWTLSALGGAVVAYGVLSFGTSGLLLLALLMLVAMRSSERRMAIGGVLSGFGAAAAYAIVAANARCAEANVGQSSCVAHNVTPAMTIAVLTLAAGAGLTLIPLIARSRKAGT
jgi:hypothetical protein